MQMQGNVHTRLPERSGRYDPPVCPEDIKFVLNDHLGPRTRPIGRVPVHCTIFGRSRHCAPAQRVPHDARHLCAPEQESTTPQRSPGCPLGRRRVVWSHNATAGLCVQMGRRETFRRQLYRGPDARRHWPNVASHAHAGQRRPPNLDDPHRLYPQVQPGIRPDTDRNGHLGGNTT
ncbi:hypothetical protein BC828DRAFT_390676 [Blastocladiella britannica]|nr:hypothetical protein BC828DRAFT_390676 [Blastocladiella britannica]